MPGNRNATPVVDGVDWVGYVDWSVRDFHGYSADRGTTYNAYLVRDQKTALIDTVKEPFGGELLDNVSAQVDPGSVHFIVCNHAEPDHAGALPKVITALPNAALVCNKRCVAALSSHFDTSGWRIHTVATGDSLSLGGRTLQFIETPMVHWPESMFTYIVEDKLLFSMDAFGQHYATSERFDDEVPLCTSLEEAKAYYANIIMPFGREVTKALERTAALDVEIIAPSHGVIWRRNVQSILQAYHNWSVCRPKPKVLVIYDTMWESTGRMAQAICEGACRDGVEARLIHLRRTSLTRIATDVLDAAAIAFGSSTLNRTMMPMAGAVLTYLQGLRPAGKAAFAFGSYGWGPGGPETVQEYLKTLDWQLLRGPLKARYRPTAEVLDECREAGRMLAEKALDMAGDRRACENVCVDP